jgi:purine nucleosidase
MKVIIDTDCGVDDVFAIVAALKLYDVLAITCVSGNVHCNQAVNNVGVILEQTNNIQIPYYKGQTDYILGDWKPSEFHGHGDDVLGNTWMKPLKAKPQNESAVNALIRLSKQYTDIHLFAIGPLTNIALATLIDPDFPKRIKQFTVMGGSHQSKGNNGLVSEFNFACDPEAASICLNKFTMTCMVTWETCVKHRIPWSYFDKIVSSDKPINRFLTRSAEPYVDIYGKDNAGYIVCGLMAIISPLSINEKKSNTMVCKIELDGTFSRGATMFDWLDIEEVIYDRKSNVRLIKLNQDKMDEVLDAIFFY